MDLRSGLLSTSLGAMEGNMHKLIAALDEQIANLRQARALLADEPQRKHAVHKVARVMSAEGRARIGAAQSKRWAATRKAA